MGLRHWFFILSVSLLLHLAVFWPLPEARLQEARLSTFSVRIVSPVSGPAVSDLSEEGSMLPAPTPDPLHVPRRSEVKSGSLRDAGAETGLLELGRNGIPKAALIGSRPEVSSTGKGDVPSQGRTDGSAISETGSLTRYRLALAAAAVRIRAGVTTADEGLTGTAVVDVRFSGPTSVPQVTLSSSSGFEQLDNEAVALLARAVHMVPVSDAGPVGDVSLRLPVVFESVGK